MSNFGQRFKELRTSEALTQSAIAEELDLKLRVIQYYEKNERYPDFKGLLNIADYFKVSIDYLVGRSDNPEIK